MRIVLPVVALLVLTLVVGLALFLLREGEGPAGPLGPATTEPPTAVEGAAAGAGEGGPEGGPAGGTADGTAREPRGLGGGNEVDPRPKAERVELSGRALVVDEGDVLRADESGRVVLLERTTRGARRVLAAVEAGRFEARLALGSRVEVLELELGGRPAHVDREPLEVPAAAGSAAAAEPFEIVGTWARPVRLRVVDAETGGELDGLTVSIGAAAHPLLGAPPAAGAVILSDRPSPVALPPPVRLPARSQRVWVRGPRHAWTAIDVDYLSGGERQVALPRAAALLVEVTGESPPAEAVVRVRPRVAVGRSGRLRPGEPIVERRPAAEILLEALAPGPHLVTVESGTTRLADAEVELVAGARTEARLAVGTAVVEEAGAALAGTLLLPVAWERAGVRLRVATARRGPAGAGPRADLPVEAMEPVDGRADLLAWSAGPLAPGRYVLEVFPLSYRVAVEVGAEGVADARIAVPPPAEVSVRVLDADTGAPADVERLTWRGPLPEGVDRYLPGAVHPDPETGSFEFRAPVGEVWIATVGGSYQRRTTRELLFPGRNTVTIETRAACGVALGLFDGGARLPWDPSWHVDLREVDGPGRRVAVRNGRLEVSNPGRYRMKIGTIEGFQAIEEREVVVERGRFTTVDVALLRSR